jgi:probable F420-dependent oxidoreductase
MTADYEALGFALDEAGVRVDRLEEAVQVVKGAWAEGRYDHAGTHYTITGYDGIPAPRQQPRIPVLIGGGGRRVLSLAGREADIVGINPNLRAGVIGVEAAQDSVREMTERKIAWVRDAAGSRFDDLELQIRYFAAAITDDAAGMAETMAPMFGIEPSAALEAGTVLVGTVGQCVETLQRRREEWGVSYVVLGDDQLEAFAPVVAALAGT